jgi:hypothetical protein
MATTVWPIVIARASTAGTRPGGTSWTRITSTTIVISQPPARATVATLSRPMTNMTRDRLATTAVPAMAGAYKTNSQVSCET